MGAKPRRASGGEPGLEAVYRQMRELAATSGAEVGDFSRRRVAVAPRRDDGALWVTPAEGADAPTFLAGYDDLRAASWPTDTDPHAIAETLLEAAEGRGDLEDGGTIVAHPPGGPRLTTQWFATRARPRGPGAWRDPADIAAAHRDGTRLQTPSLLAAAGVANHDERAWPLAAHVDVVSLATPTLPPATHTNGYLIGGEEMVLVDPATPHAAEQRALDALLDDRAGRGRRLVEIWLTHHHQDHVGDAARVARSRGVPIAAHPETARRLGTRVPVSRLLADGDERELAGDPARRLRAVFTPGHAPGHHCFLEETTTMMVAGDMVAGVGTILVDPSEGDMAAYLDSLERMRALAPRRLLPAHGPILADPAAALARLVAHRMWRESRVVAALDELGEARLEGLVPRVYADVAPVLHGLAARSLLAHLLKLGAEGRATRTDGVWRPSR